MKIWIAAACFALAGCTAVYQKQDLAGTGLTATTHLSAATRMYVALPADGAYEMTTYAGSGLTTAQSIAAAFAKHGSSVTIAEATASREQTVAAARAAGTQYAAIPLISHWEPRATAWSGLPSRMSISLTLVDVQTGTVLSNTSLSGSSASFTLAPTSPEALLAAPISEYVDSLYAR
jgi:hypothetical protein